MLRLISTERYVIVVIMISSQKNCQPLITQTSRSITKIVLKRKETELKGEIIHKVIIDNFYQRKLI